MKVLIISAEVWQDSTNGGNVLSNVFGGTNFEIAQIYCNPGTPQNNLCTHYYQMTDGMVIRNFLNHKPIGRAFDMRCSLADQNEEKPSAEQPNKSFYSFFHRHRLGIFFIAKNFLWNTSNWKNDALQKFVTDFDPDIIFAPCYGSEFMLRLTRHIAEMTGKNVISYISDDSYTLKQFRISPLYWLERFSVRRQLRKTFPYYSLVYTMTEIQKKQCERDFKANMKILLKPIPFGVIPEKKTVGTPIRLVYAGGIYLNRWKTLAAIADAIRELNCDGVKIILDIYTGNEVSPEINKKLNDGVHSVIHGSVSQEELCNIYHNSDIALHVESFDLKNRLAVRMSFSTKIVDCLASGCAVMAVCDEKQGGMVYLEENDAAICVTDQEDIYKTLRSLADSPQRIVEYAAKAKQCCIRNHSQEQNRAMILEDFERIVHENRTN